MATNHLESALPDAVAAVSDLRPALGERRHGTLRKVFSFRVFLGALLVAGVFLNLRVRLQNDASLPTGHWHATFVEGDTFWHIAAGQRILATGTWPTSNYYSFTAPKSDWLAYEWLGEVKDGPRGLRCAIRCRLGSRPARPPTSNGTPATQNGKDGENCLA